MYQKNNMGISAGGLEAGSVRVRVSFGHTLQTRLEPPLVKHPKLSPVQPIAVRTRRAYFDCKFGQLHVRTAFPTTGGFDEQVTLFCLHPSEGSSRGFDRLLPEMAHDRSVYAPDLPGFGESDPAPSFASSDAARAVSDLATDLRLRRIDVLGVGFGAAVALELAAARPDLVRRLVLTAVPPMDRKPAAAQETLVLEGADELLGAMPAAPASHVRAFLRG